MKNKKMKKLELTWKDPNKEYFTGYSGEIGDIELFLVFWDI